jgi:hypothetical protein
MKKKKRKIWFFSSSILFIEEIKQDPKKDKMEAEPNTDVQVVLTPLGED